LRTQKKDVTLPFYFARFELIPDLLNVLLNLVVSQSDVPDVLRRTHFLKLPENLRVFYRLPFKLHLENSIPVQLLSDQDVTVVVLLYAAEG